MRLAAKKHQFPNVKMTGPLPFEQSQILQLWVCVACHLMHHLLPGFITAPGLDSRPS